MMAGSRQGVKKERKMGQQRVFSVPAPRFCCITHGVGLERDGAGGRRRYAPGR